MSFHLIWPQTSKVGLAISRDRRFTEILPMRASNISVMIRWLSPDDRRLKWTSERVVDTVSIVVEFAQLGIWWRFTARGGIGKSPRRGFSTKALDRFFQVWDGF